MIWKKIEPINDIYSNALKLYEKEVKNASTLEEKQAAKKKFDRTINPILVYGRDYTISYYSNTNPGTAKMVITGKGKYSGSITKTYKIEIRKPELNGKYTTNASTQMVTLAWTTLTETSGYELYRSEKSDSGYTKISTSDIPYNVIYKDANRSSGKIYYYKVRAYKIIDGKKYYSDFSKVFSI